MEDLTRRLYHEEPSEDEKVTPKPIEETSKFPNLANYDPKERKFDYEQYGNILQVAENIQSKRKNQDKIKGELEKRADDFLSNPKGIAESRLYEMGETYGISKEDIQEAIKTLYPGNQEMLKSLESFGGSHDQLDTTQLYSQRILTTLREKFPEDEFYANISLVEEGYGPCKLTFYRKSKEISKRKKWLLFGKEIRVIKKKKEKLAQADCYSTGLLMNLYSPMFLEVTKDEIKKLDEIIGGKSEVKRKKYRIGLDDKI